MKQQTSTISKMETTQTAVEYLLEKLYTEYRFSFSGTIVDQAKEMEKQQILNAYLNGSSRVTPYGYYTDSAEQYYNETYKK